MRSMAIFFKFEAHPLPRLLQVNIQTVIFQEFFLFVNLGRIDAGSLLSKVVIVALGRAL